MSGKNSVPYFDVKRQYTGLKKEFEAALKNVASSGAYILAAPTAEFEQQFAKYCGGKYAIGVGSGTDALVLSMKASGIGPGDEVIAPSFTFVATAFAIMHVGATPVLVDVDPQTYTLSAAAVEKAITKKTKAILPVHLYGQAADMDKLMAVANKHNLMVFEDACQAHGATFKKRKTGSFGTAGCFSFYPTKNLGAMGDGGCIVTSDEKLVEKIHRLRNLGRKSVKENHSVLGWTSRLDSLQASVLSVKLKHLDRFNDGRRKAAALYRKLLAGTPVVLPSEGANRKHVYHLFVILAPGGKRDSLQAYLAEKGINTMIHYPAPVHRQPACEKASKVPHALPVTDKLCGQILSLPMFPEITEKEVRAVAEGIQSFYGRR